MIVYRDLISGDEMISDSYKLLPGEYYNYVLSSFIHSLRNLS